MDKSRSKGDAARRNMRWAEAEDALLRACYPDYRMLQRHLPHRTLSALKHRVRVIGIVERRHVWTNHEIARLHKAYEAGVSDHELAALFPELRLSQVKGKASHIRAVRHKMQPIRFAVPALDAIRARSVEMRLSFVELDRRAGTGRYFQKSCRRPSLKYIARAAALLGAEVSIEWSE